mgnify:CR=1 FL=1
MLRWSFEADQRKIPGRPGSAVCGWESLGLQPRLGIAAQHAHLEQVDTAVASRCLLSRYRHPPLLVVSFAARRGSGRGSYVAAIIDEAGRVFEIVSDGRVEGAVAIHTS